MDVAYTFLIDYRKSKKVNLILYFNWRLMNLSKNFKLRHVNKKNLFKSHLNTHSIC